MEVADIGLSAYCTRRRTTASRVNPTRGVVWLGNVARHNSRVLLAAGNSGRNGREVIVGCLQQYQVSNDGVPSGQPVERHGRTHSMMRSNNSNSGRGHGGSRSVHFFVSRSFMVRQHREAGGRDRSGQIGEFISAMDPPFDRNIIFGRIWRLLIYGKGGDP